jgi:nucleotide-binding universal stress UspA family protein
VADDSDPVTAGRYGFKDVSVFRVGIEKAPQASMQAALPTTTAVPVVSLKVWLLAMSRARPFRSRALMHSLNATATAATSFMPERYHPGPLPLQVNDVEFAGSGRSGGWLSCRLWKSFSWSGRRGHSVDPPGFCKFMSAESWPAGPIVLGVAWDFSEQLVVAAAGLAAGLGLHLVIAFVDPASYLTEWGPGGSLTAASLDPAANEETDFPSGQLLQRLEAVLGSPGADWSFRVLNGDVAPALGRLAKSADASLIIVGGRRPGILAAMDRFLEGSVSAVLVRSQWRPVLIVPCCA